MQTVLAWLACVCAAASGIAVAAERPEAVEKPRVLVTTDGEADDRCSMIRFLLSANEFDVEGIVNSSSQFHWEGGEGWHAFHAVDWVEKQINLYRQVYDNLLLHDPDYPSPDFLLSRWKVGNIAAVGDDQTRSEGAELIANVLLDDTDPRPAWLQAWRGCNTIARALRIIQDEHPQRMQEVAARLRLFLIWEQDETYQSSIRHVWEPLGVTTIISDQFDCMAYIWPQVLPEEVQVFFRADWMQANVLQGHGPLCSAYESKDNAFHAEGDTPAFLHAIPTGLRSRGSPDWGGWGGRYVHVRGSVWMDPPPSPSWQHPTGRWGIANSWSKQLEHATAAADVQMRTEYFRPLWRWLPAVQNDFAARADWCVQPYSEANHPPVVALTHSTDLTVLPGSTVGVSAEGTSDPDQDPLTFRWWHHREASTSPGEVALTGSRGPRATVRLPTDLASGETIHLICEVTDQGSPPLTRYARVVLTAE